MGFLHAKKIKDNDGLIAGCFCAFAPRELLAAAGFTTVNICNAAKEHELAAIADQIPRGICSAVKATYGLALADRCPYIHFSDILIGEDICSGRLQIYHLLKKLKDVYIIHLPQGSNADTEMEAELRKLASFLTDRFNCRIDDQALREQIIKSNQQTQLQNTLVMLCRANPPRLGGYNLAKLLDGAEFIFDHQDKLQKLNSVIDQASVAPNSSGKRVIISGCGLNGFIDKIIKPVEDLGAHIVAFDNCRWGLSPLCDENIAQTNPWQALAKKYNSIHCLQRQNDSIAKLIADTNAEALINVGLSCCSVCQIAYDHQQIPILNISTNYTDNDKDEIKDKLVALLAN